MTSSYIILLFFRYKLTLPSYLLFTVIIANIIVNMIINSRHAAFWWPMANFCRIFNQSNNQFIFFTKFAVSLTFGPKRELGTDNTTA